MLRFTSYKWIFQYASSPTGSKEFAFALGKIQSTSPSHNNYYNLYERVFFASQRNSTKVIEINEISWSSCCITYTKKLPKFNVKLGIDIKSWKVGCKD